jgi:tRNA threonylcarbamoyl adenosine modification protein YjeE
MTPITTIALPDEAATCALGARLAAALVPGDCILLIGDLGAGKTTLARGLINALAGEDIEVPSPTFTIVQGYDTDPPILHFDLYRLKHPDEVWELGWEELDQSVSLIEWPDRAGPNLPEQVLQVQLSFDGNARFAAVNASGEAIGRWTGVFASS